MTIRRLDTNLINQIAAGEVIERPSSVVKEVLDNAIDAGADDLLIDVCEGGKTLIRIKDNGSGMSYDDLCLCAERHTTSKLPDNNLFNIQTFGFRGEALASIGSISRLYITTKTKEMDHAWKLGVEGGEISTIVPATHSIGTFKILKINKH
jgi:DNA mismatch repair protein MutL